jgi:histidine triad (HIT) family protein
MFRAGPVGAGSKARQEARTALERELRTSCAIVESRLRPAMGQRFRSGPEGRDFRTPVPRRSTSGPQSAARAAVLKEHPMADTIFTKILAGQIPCHKVYEDEKVLAFLDINPLSTGHTLVIPKEPAETLDRLSDDSAAALGRVLPRICRAVIAVTGIRQYNVLENNGSAAHQAIAHVHFHIIPKPNAIEGLGIGWPQQAFDHKAGGVLAAKLRAALDS